MNRSKMTLGVSYSPPPGSPEQIQRDSFVSSKHYSTSVKTSANAPETKSGRPLGSLHGKPSENDAETKGLHLLRQWGYTAIQSPDWLARKDGEWICLEIKQKELYTAGRDFPFLGIGLNKSQLFLRQQLLGDWGVRTYLINFVPETDEIYGAYLTELEKKGDFYDTPNDIRVYPIKNYNKGVEAIRNDLNGR